MPDYDVVVIGSGTAAQNVAPRCAQEGLRVAVVDRLPYGGTCGQRGCDPKKVLLAAAEAVGRARMLDGRGLAGAPAIDWPALMARKRTFTAPVPERIESWMRDAGADTLHGAARLRSAHEVEVDGRALEREGRRDRERRPAHGAGHPGRRARDHEHRVPGAGGPAAARRLHRRRLHHASSSPGSRAWPAPR